MFLPTMMILLGGCKKQSDDPPHDSRQGGDDSGGPGDDTAPTDVCDDHPGQVICYGNEAIQCDGDGNVVGTQKCGDDGIEACFADVGCVVCLPALTAPYANKAIYESDGIFLGADPNPILEDLEQQWVHLRPVALGVDPSLTVGEITIDTTGDLDVLLADGTPLTLPATLVPEDRELLIRSGHPGQAEVVATFVHDDATCTAVEARLRVTVGYEPGLVGRPLASYPHFEHARAANDVDTLYAALDPSRYFDRVGLSADLYVVEWRDPAEWFADRTLAAVVGTGDNVTISSGSIVDNTWEIWSGPMDAGDRFGKNYQVVIDFGGDGQLDEGDLVTGVSGSAVLVARDLSLPGPYKTAQAQYSGGYYLGQRTYFPADVEKMGTLPLVVISHGNGHDYTWYDYLGEHLASHGAVVMAHQNNTGPGIETASDTTLLNTDYFLGSLATIAGGVLDGHVDGHRLVWIGHSRGGEGVVRAYDKIFDGDFVPDDYTIDDIVLVSSIAPTVYSDIDDSDPHDVTYHLMAGTADGDVDGGPERTYDQFFRISQKATGTVQTTYVQGADHNDFNCCGFQDGSGPDLIGRTEAQTIAKGVYLALFMHYAEGHPTAKEFVTRMYESLHSSGISSNVTISRTYRDALDEPNLVIDDYQSEPGTDTSSCGGAVTFDVGNLFEGRLDDDNLTFTWTKTDPMNGMTQAAEPEDLAAGVVFDWDKAPAFYALEIPPGSRDLLGYETLSFRACQGTRHPRTLSLDGPLSFTVTLSDGAGRQSAIDFGAYGQITPIYGRTGAGPGVGWANEFNTVRIPLLAFETDGSGVDLSDIVEIRFEFGPDFGSPQGRVGLDDVALTLH